MLRYPVFNFSMCFASGQQGGHGQGGGYGIGNVFGACLGHLTIDHEYSMHLPLETTHLFYTANNRRGASSVFVGRSPRYFNVLHDDEQIHSRSGGREVGGGRKGNGA